jgi:hypothetical protein
MLLSVLKDNVLDVNVLLQKFTLTIAVHKTYLVRGKEILQCLVLSHRLAGTFNLWRELGGQYLYILGFDNETE